MSKQEQLPPILSYPIPEPESANYIFIARPGFVTDRGSFYYGRDTSVEEPRLSQLEDKLNSIEDLANSRLSWVEFYQRAAIKVRHPERFEGDAAGPADFWDDGKPQAVEEVYGELFPAASPQLVTGVSKDGFTFATVEEILGQGSVSTFMTKWLERYSVEDNAHGFNRFLIPLLPLLDPDLSDAIRNNKFHDIDFED